MTCDSEHCRQTKAEQNGCRQRFAWHLSCHRRSPFAVARLAALRESPDAFSSTLDHESVQPSAWWIDRLSSDTVTTFIADGDAPQCIGTLGTYGDDHDCGIYGIWVAQQARGSGLSDALLLALVGHARARGFTRVLLDVGTQNTHAVRLYDRHGFVATGETSRLPEPRSHIQELQMALNLTPLP